MGYEGIGLFLDADMLMRGDVAELFSLKDETAVQVVKNKQRFEWGSMMLFDNAKCKVLTPGYIDDKTTNPLALKWANPIGDLPPEWNHCVGYDQPNSNAKLVHYTKGVPCWPETKGCEHSDAWWEEFRKTNSTVSHQELMGRSIHVAGA